MRRSAEMLEEMTDPIRKAVGLPIGPQGAYFVGARDDFGSPSILSYSDQPDDQPSLWCQWVPNEAGTAIEWNGADKFHHFVEWLEYLLKHFLKPWGYTVNGKVRWKDDGVEWSEKDQELMPCVEHGEIVVRDNVIEVKSSISWLR